MKVWRQLSEFCTSVGRQEWSSPPVASYTIFLFLTHSFQLGKVGSTIASMASAVSYVHKLAGLTDPCATHAIKKFIVATQKKSPSLDLRCPINGVLLAKLVQSVPSVCQAYEAVLLKALFLTLFHGCFRVGELVARCGAQKHLVVQYSDISFCLQSYKAISCKIVLKYSKNGKPGETQIVTLGSHTGACPLEALLAFIKSRGDAVGPLFSYPDGSGFFRNKFAKLLALVLRHIGLNPNLYKGHSFRIGAATQAAADGKSDADIRCLGRWRSDAFKKYIRFHKIQ